MNAFIRCGAVFGLAVATRVAGASNLPLPALTTPTNEREPGFHLELLPKAFQRNPQLEMTVLTEVTPDGRAQPAPAPESPAYYAIYNSGMQQRGQPVAGFTAPDPVYLEDVLRRALRASGFLPADPEHAPSVFLVLHWGVHSQMDFEMRRMFPELALRHRLERMRLVGGRRFETFLLRHIQFAEGRVPLPSKQENLHDQAMQDIYFAIVSAYDYAALSNGRRRLLWRTSLTAGATGVSLRESMPALLLSGGPYFGREMPEPEFVFRRLRRGVVEFGEPQVVETDVDLSR
ncbi:MAG TPA: hypothetical protein VNR00_20400 [Opitutus sp.]|nr:hypothetical protein [Opitutus sp.]